MAYPTVESVTTTDFATDSTTHNASMPSTVNAGDLLIALCGFDVDTTESVTTPSGWVKLAEHSATNSGLLAIFWRRATGSEGGTTVNFATTNAQKGTVQVYRLSNAARVERDVISSTTTNVSGPRVRYRRGFAADRVMIGATVKSTLSGWTADLAGWSDVTTTGQDDASGAAVRSGRATGGGADGPEVSYLPVINGYFMACTVVGTGATLSGEVTLDGSAVSGAEVLIIESEDTDGWVTPRIAGVAVTDASGAYSAPIADGVRVAAAVYYRSGANVYTALTHHSIKEV
jgi:hypothetical protein